jgi:hypothetical protein
MLAVPIFPVAVAAGLFGAFCAQLEKEKKIAKAKKDKI